MRRAKARPTRASRGARGRSQGAHQACTNAVQASNCVRCWLAAIANQDSANAPIFSFTMRDISRRSAAPGLAPADIIRALRIAITAGAANASYEVRHKQA